MMRFSKVMNISSSLGILLAVAGKASADLTEDEKITNRAFNNYVNKADPEIGYFTDFMCNNAEALDIVVPVFTSYSEENAAFGRTGFNDLMCRTPFYNRLFVSYVKVAYRDAVNDPSLTIEDYTFWDFFKELDENGAAILRAWGAKMDSNKKLAKSIIWVRQHGSIYVDAYRALYQVRAKLEPLYEKSKSTGKFLIH